MVKKIGIGSKKTTVRYFFDKSEFYIAKAFNNNILIWPMNEYLPLYTICYIDDKNNSLFKFYLLLLASTIKGRIK